VYAPHVKKIGGTDEMCDQGMGCLRSAADIAANCLGMVCRVYTLWSELANHGAKNDAHLDLSHGSGQMFNLGGKENLNV